VFYLFAKLHVLLDSLVLGCSPISRFNFNQTSHGESVPKLLQDITTKMSYIMSHDSGSVTARKEEGSAMGWDVEV